MRMLQTLLLLIGAMAVLVMGAGAPASAAEAAPCHAEGAAHHSAPDAPDAPATPSKALKAMGCCVVCVTAPLPQPGENGTAAVPTARPVPLLMALPHGLIPSPEPFPPRA